MTHLSTEIASWQFLEAVEFPALLRELSLGCQTSSGKAVLAALRPLSEAAPIGERLEKTRELEQHIVKDAPPSIPDSEGFRKAFEAAREKGEVLLGEELSRPGKVLGGGRPTSPIPVPGEGNPGVIPKLAVRIKSAARIKRPDPFPDLPQRGNDG